MRKFNVNVNGVNYEVAVEEVGTTSSVSQTVAPVQTVQAAPAVATPKVEEKKVETVAGEAVKAPMPGTINDVKTSVGSSVKKGDVLVILEAMKMENEIVAPRDGKVAQVVVAKGASVNTGDNLVVLE